MAKHIFTDEDTAQLMDYWNGGLTAREIAVAMDRPYNNIRNKIKQLQQKELIAPRDNKIQLPDNFIEITAGVHNLPVDIVEHFRHLFGGTTDKIVTGVEQACVAYTAQQGKCFYLGDMSVLTPDNSPSGIMVSTGPQGELVLVCRAISSLKNSLSHATFVAVCKKVANAFS